jgi:hypothetical protein
MKAFLYPLTLQHLEAVAGKAPVKDGKAAINSNVIDSSLILNVLDHENGPAKGLPYQASGSCVWACLRISSCQGLGSTGMTRSIRTHCRGVLFGSRLGVILVQEGDLDWFKAWRTATNLGPETGSRSI